MPDTNQVLSDLQDGVQTITLNQPEKFNALSSAMLTGLSEALRVAERDAAVRAVVLTGAGKAFSSGADITEFNVGDQPLPGHNCLLEKTYHLLPWRLTVDSSRRRWTDATRHSNMVGARNNA